MAVDLQTATVSELCAAFGTKITDVVMLIELMGKLAPEDAQKLIWQATGTAVALSIEREVQK